MKTAVIVLLCILVIFLVIEICYPIYFIGIPTLIKWAKRRVKRHNENVNQTDRDQKNN